MTLPTLESATLPDVELAVALYRAAWVLETEGRKAVGARVFGAGGRMRMTADALHRSADALHRSADALHRSADALLATTSVARARDSGAEAARIGDGWVFPSPTEPEKPIRRDLLRDWWQKLEAKAKLERVRGRGWHSLRRKFATDLKHDTPLADLCALGGWKDHNTVLRCYMRPDEVTMRAAPARRAERRASAG